MWIFLFLYSRTTSWMTKCHWLVKFCKQLFKCLHILFSFSCLATSKLDYMLCCTTKSQSPKRSTCSKIMTAAWVNSRQRLTEVQKTDWTFGYYFWMGRPRELKQSRYLAAPLTCHTGLIRCQAGIFCFHLFSCSVTSYRFFFMLNSTCSISFFYLNYSRTTHCTSIRSNRHSSMFSGIFVLV